MEKGENQVNELLCPLEEGDMVRSESVNIVVSLWEQEIMPCAGEERQGK